MTRRPRSQTRQVSRPIVVDGVTHLLTWHIASGAISLRPKHGRRARAPFITVEQLSRVLLSKLL